MYCFRGGSTLRRRRGGGRLDTWEGGWSGGALGGTDVEVDIMGRGEWTSRGCYVNERRA